MGINNNIKNMKNLTDLIQEKLKIGSKVKIDANNILKHI